MMGFRCRSVRTLAMLLSSVAAVKVCQNNQNKVFTAYSGWTSDMNSKWTGEQAINGQGEWVMWNSSKTDTEPAFSVKVYSTEKTRAEGEAYSEDSDYMGEDFMITDVTIECGTLSTLIFRGPRTKFDSIKGNGNEWFSTFFFNGDLEGDDATITGRGVSTKSWERIDEYNFGDYALMNKDLTFDGHVAEDRVGKFVFKSNDCPAGLPCGRTSMANEKLMSATVTCGSMEVELGTIPADDLTAAEPGFGCSRVTMSITVPDDLKATEGLCGGYEDDSMYDLHDECLADNYHSAACFRKFSVYTQQSPFRACKMGSIERDDTLEIYTSRRWATEKTDEATVTAPGRTWRGVKNRPELDYAERTMDLEDGRADCRPHRAYFDGKYEDELYKTALSETDAAIWKVYFMCLSRYLFDPWTYPVKNTAAVDTDGVVNGPWDFVRFRTELCAIAVTYVDKYRNNLWCMNQLGERNIKLIREYRILRDKQQHEERVAAYIASELAVYDTNDSNSSNLTNMDPTTFETVANESEVISVANATGVTLVQEGSQLLVQQLTDQAARYVNYTELVEYHEAVYRAYLERFDRSMHGIEMWRPLRCASDTNRKEWFCLQCKENQYLATSVSGDEYCKNCPEGKFSVEGNEFCSSPDGTVDEETTDDTDTNSTNTTDTNTTTNTTTDITDTDAKTLMQNVDEVPPNAANAQGKFVVESADMEKAVLAKAEQIEAAHEVPAPKEHKHKENAKQDNYPTRGNAEPQSLESMMHRQSHNSKYARKKHR